MTLVTTFDLLISKNRELYLKTYFSFLVNFGTSHGIINI